MHSSVCCFSGYRPEKMPADMAEGSPAFCGMQQRLRRAIRQASDGGFRHFLSGMSRGFDLWAAEAVLELAREGCPIDLWAAIAFPGMQKYWEPEWSRRYDAVLDQAARVFALYDRYQPDCYTTRDRFLVEQSSACICFFDGTPGGTAYTVGLARRRGLDIINLADPQLSLFENETITRGSAP